MRLISFLLLSSLLFSGCKDAGNPNEKESTESTDQSQSVDLTRYPAALVEVFKAHGGLEQWNQMKTLTYTMGKEVHTTNLHNRDIVIKTDDYSIGGSGGKVWIAQDSTFYPPSRARFYHNLMFYFYAMPFIVADDGIIYSEAPALQKDGISYPAIKIAYENNIGDSPDDEYIIYYHPETKRMEWLAYTVTYGKEGKSDQFKYIKYSKWNEINELLLPTELDWYETENNLPTTSRNSPRIFTNIDIDASDMDKDFYQMPENGSYVD
ncbi:MAG: DUF6503 family protein [Nonlabens sp.]